METKPRVINRQPYWEEPPQPGQRLRDLKWVTVEFLSDKTFRIVAEAPDSEELESFIRAMEADSYECMTPEMIRALMKERGWTNRALAVRWKRSETWISKIINDSRRDPYWDDAFNGLPFSLTSTDKRRN